MTRELKLSLILGFAVVLVVTILLSDHFSAVRKMALHQPAEALPMAVVRHMEATKDMPGPMGVPTDPTVRIDEPIVRNDQPVVPRGDEQASNTAEDPVVISNTGGSRDLPDEPAASTSGGVATHVVAQGESLFEISKKYLGSGHQWKTIRDANKGKVAENGSVRAGVELVIPGAALAKASAKGEAKPEAKVTTKEKTDTTGKTRVYKVRQGDTPGSIARKLLGSSSKAADLMKLNGIEDDGGLKIGMNLKVP